ncbi:MAG: hypothetical protein RIQ53_4198 [Pseudomonadota bacterium]|jgi:hypothetical protein
MAAALIVRARRWARWRLLRLRAVLLHLQADQLRAEILRLQLERTAASDAMASALLALTVTRDRLRLLAADVARYHRSQR